MPKFNHRLLLAEEAEAITDVQVGLLDELLMRIEDFAPLRIQILLEEAKSRDRLWLKRKFFDQIERTHAKKIRKNDKMVLFNPDIAGHIASYLDDTDDVYNFSKSISATVDNWPFLLDFLRRNMNFGFNIFTETLMEIGDQLLEEKHRLKNAYITSLSAIKLRSCLAVQTHPVWSWAATIPAWNAICSWVARKGVQWFWEYMKNPIIVEPPEIEPPLRLVTPQASILLITCNWDHRNCNCKLFNKALSPVIKAQMEY
jgi:hypothetical protein